MSELLPCPFCGSVRAPEVSDVGECEECSKFDDCGRRLENRTCEGCDRWERPMFVVCNYNIGGCGASGPYRKTEAEAIATWNTRHQCGLTDEDYSILLDELGVSERTCKMEPTFINPQAFENVQEFTCTACGRFTIVEQLGDDEDRPSYCPNCGCKVIGG